MRRCAANKCKLVRRLWCSGGRPLRQSSPRRNTAAISLKLTRVLSKSHSALMLRGRSPYNWLGGRCAAHAPGALFFWRHYRGRKSCCHGRVRANGRRRPVGVWHGGVLCPREKPDGARNGHAFCDARARPLEDLQLFEVILPLCQAELRKRLFAIPRIAQQMPRRQHSCSRPCHKRLTHAEGRTAR